ncbi:Aste57867_20258 [Aphanomyces stellatus]|uniref:Aste57867_20258 protein n=1 Tax=Aphanomyces stellatus TaxID=120398 RepID=A0A485LGJ7_9STRA|nr:hypothetical protein As57867_020192 [Aphanomyces stellatus]VFT96948.1 Aste57867_20258 [Aphanomyces stellatus]
MMHSFYLRGLGFFNDAYDLSVINIINVILQHQYGPSVYTSQLQSAVSASALLGAVLGQLVFGFLGDVYGRKKCMVVTCVLLIVGGALCGAACGPDPATTLWFLVVARGILGFGIGGEYPLAAASSAEDATSPAERNTRVALTFSLQGVGFLVASLMGLLFIALLEETPETLEMMWRGLFLVGVLPALFLVKHRWTADETADFQHRECRHVTVPWSFVLRHYGRALVGTAGTWFLFDIVFYAQNLFSASILAVVGAADRPSLVTVAWQNVAVSVLALPGYYVAVYYINSLGRRRMQLLGLAAMLLIFLVLGLSWHALQTSPVLFVLLFGLTLFFSNFGPNMATFVFPTELFPTPIRSSCHGLSAAMGKVGAAVGSYGFSLSVQVPGFGFPGVFFTFALLCLVAISLTFFCLFDNTDGPAALDAAFYARVQQRGEEKPLKTTAFV